jgi:protein-arginine kinase activator protein McsA
MIALDYFDYYESVIDLYKIGLSKNNRIKALKEDLALAIEVENYEVCCLIRDELIKY